jgi:hypothetical protein
MNDKIKWLGRYLGCDILYENLACELEGVDIHTDCVIVERVNCHVDKVKLILKELKDISDEDIIECSKVVDSASLRNLLCFEINSAIKYDANSLNFNLSCNVIDFLRSKSYAIGIPKEYYITEKELEETK